MPVNSHVDELRLDRLVFRVALALAIFCIGLFIASLYHRIVTVDDAWFAEQAYWFARDGYVHSDLFEGFPLFAHEILVYHKLHIWQGALVYRLFGWNAYFFKAIAIPYLILFLALVYSLLKQIAPLEHRRRIFAVFVALFFINHLAFQEGFEYRPEIPMMCTGLLSYMFLRLSMANTSMKLAVLSGVMAGIAALFHLNGLIFIAAGGLLLLINRQFKLSVWFGLGAFIGFLPYFHQLASIDRLQHYVFALTHDPAVSSEDRSLSGMFMKLLTEYHRFTHHVYEFTYLFIFIITLTCNWKRITQNPEYKNLLLYTLFLTVFMALITTGSKTSYLLYSMPYVLLIISIHFTQVLLHKRAAPAFLLILLVYFLANLDRDHGVFVDRKYDSPQLYASIIRKYDIKPGEEIFAPALFIFNEIGKVKIQCYLAYLAKYHNDLSKITVDNVLGDIYRRHKSFAILSPSMLKDLKLVPHKNSIYAGYQYLGQDADLYIFKRVPGYRPAA